MSNALDRIAQQGTTVARNRSEVTAIEQARAIAEVQAAVFVAQQSPRNTQGAMEDMRESTKRTALANRAFYRVPNRGNGPSVHLARELARIWGNMQYGVVELRRDDVVGESEMQAFAWDLQTNSRTVRSFIAPHARMKGKERQALTDLNDIYLSNQNTGARAVRECIFSILPAWFVEEAQERCRETLEKGEGEPLEARVKKMVDVFRGIGVTVEQIETKLGRKKGQWTAGDVADMGTVFGAIRAGDVTKDEEFPQQRVTGADLVGEPQ